MIVALLFGLVIVGAGVGWWMVQGRRARDTRQHVTRAWLFEQKYERFGDPPGTQRR